MSEHLDCTNQAFNPAGIATALRSLIQVGAVAGIIELFQSTEQNKGMLFEIPIINEIDFVAALNKRKNRYDPVGLQVSQVPVEYGWEAVANAEIRDMNRHRPGIRDIGFYPKGFYFALDEIVAAVESTPGMIAQFKTQADSLILRFAALGQRYRDFAIDTINGDKGVAESNFVYFSGLGTELSFSHTSTLGHLIYECELRTGPGTHFRYRSHYQSLIKAMIDQIPDLGTHMLLGSGEPE